jgi:hypothetical protein
MRSCRRVIAVPVLILAWSLLAPAPVATAGPDSEKGSEPAKPQAKPPAHQVIVYYFHTTRRCETCRNFEAYTQELLKDYFPFELEKGTIVFRVVNTDLSENRHFIDEYQLITKSVVLADVREGKQVRWKNLARIWELAHDKDAFVKYVRGEIALFL